MDEEIKENCFKMDSGNSLWISDVDSAIKKANQHYIEGDFREALRLAEWARKESIDMQNDGIESGYEFEHLARQIIAKIQAS